MSATVRVIASSRNWIDGAAVQQLERTAERDGIVLAVGLPDLHPGQSSPIGAAFLAKDVVHSALVGNDVGCGIGLWTTTLDAERPKREAWSKKLRGLEDAWDGDARAFLEERGLAISCHEASLGTIGGGNHFAEIQSIETIEDAVRYVARHDHAVAWARASRELIAERLLACFGAGGERVLDACHDFVERRPEGWLHRKGAVPSTVGCVVVPGSRGAFSYLLRPCDAGDRAAWSLAHGAGRKWSRSDARSRLEERFGPAELVRTELGSHAAWEDTALLYEEAPQAYKKIDVVIEDLVEAGLADVVATLSLLVTYKVRR